jgi:hypothetical protein
MRALTGLLVLGAVVAFPAAARANATFCPSSQSGVFTEERLSGLLKPGEDALKEALGTQFVLVWVEGARQGWGAAYSPGALDEATARAAFRERIAARVSADDAQYLDSRLVFGATPYSLAELTAAQDDAVARFAGVPLVAGIECRDSDALRVHVRVGTTETPELRAHADALVAAHGDRVRVEIDPRLAVPADIGTGVPLSQQSAPGQRPTLKVRDYVSLPRSSRCARTVGAKVRPGADVKRVRLAIGKRVSAGMSPRLKLKSRRSKVTVTVTLRDGGVAVDRFTYRRCA